MLRLSRRRLLLCSAGGAAGLGAVALLAACGGGGSAATGSSAGTTAALSPATSSAAATSAAASSVATSAAATSATSAATASSAAAATSAPSSSASSSLAAAASSAPARAGGPVTLNFYSNGDTNIHDLWNTDLLPKWNQANPTMKINLIFSEHGTDNSATIDKLAGAKAAGKPTDIDIYEGDEVQTGGQQGLFDKLSTANIPNLAKCNADVIKQRDGFGEPYRASSVVLAYNSQFVKDPPKTLDTLYDWVKANKGKFTYNPPDKGGSGDAFVKATLKKFIPQDQVDAFQTDAKYDPKLEASWDQGFALLKSLSPFVENNGFYPGGNVPVLQELGKQTIYVAPVWSDQGLSYLAQKLLPDTVKLEQLSPAFSGGASYLGTPTGSQHKQQSYQFLDWVLQPAQQSVIIDKINGYPGLEWQYMPPEVQAKFSEVAKNYDTFNFSSKFSADKNKLWYEKVAGTPPPPSK